MKRPSLPYVTTLRGATYFRRRGWPTVRLPEPSEPGFLAAYDEALRGRRAQPTRTTIDALLVSYMASDRYLELAARTQHDYGRVIRYLRDKIGDRDVSFLTRPRIIEAMTANRHRTRFANGIQEVLNVACQHGMDLGWLRSNPAEGIRKLRVPKERQKPHIPWPDAAVARFRAEGSPEARLAFEIGIGSAQRPEDWTRFRWSDFDGTSLWLTQGKTGARLTIPLWPETQAAIAAAPRRGLTILTRPDGRPHTYRTLAWLMLGERKRLGLDAYDLHALRYRALMELAWLGCTDDEVAAISGHRDRKMVAKYCGEARQIVRARQARGRRDQNGNRP